MQWPWLPHVGIMSHDSLLEAAGMGVEVLECTGVEVLAIPVVLDDASPVVMSPAVFVCAAVLVMTAAGDEDAMALEAVGAGVVVVLAAPVLLLEAASARVDEVREGTCVEVPVATVSLDDVADADSVVPGVGVVTSNNVVFSTGVSSVTLTDDETSFSLQDLPLHTPWHWHMPLLPMQRPWPPHVVIMSHDWLQLFEYTFSSQSLQSVPKYPSGHCVVVYTVSLQDSPLHTPWHLHMPLLPLQRPWPLHVVIMSHVLLHIFE